MCYSPRSLAVGLLAAIVIYASTSVPPALDAADQLRPAEIPKGATARAGKPVERLHPSEYYAITSVAYSPDGKKLAWVVHQWNGERWMFQIRQWDVQGQKELESLECKEGDEGGSAANSVIAISADGGMVAVGLGFSTGGPIKSNTRSNERVQVWSLKTGKPLDFTTFTQRGSESILAVAFAPDGKTAYSTRKQHLQQWNVADGKLAEERRYKDIEGGGHICQLFSQDGKRFATSVVHEGEANPKDGAVSLWDPATLKELKTLKIGGVPVGFSHDNKWVAVRTKDKQFLVWDIDTDKEVSRFEADVLIPGYRAVDFSKNGDRIIYRTTDKKAGIGDPATGKTLATLPGEALAVAIAPDGKSATTVCPDGTLLIWDVDSLVKGK